MKIRPTLKRSSKQATGVDRLYRRTGRFKVSFYYQYPDGRSETLATAPIDDRPAIKEAELRAKRAALDIQQGKIIVGSVGEVIDRFRREVDVTHYLDQSREGKAVREGMYDNLHRFFGKMRPQALKQQHAYQYVDARAQAGAPVKAWKEIRTFSTICKKAVRWGVIEANPFVNLDQDPHDRQVRDVERKRVVHFYLWSRRQDNRVTRVLGCMALFTYLTGFRIKEVRPLLKTCLTDEGVWAVAAKRQKGQPPVLKLREWTPRLRMVVQRTQEAELYMTQLPDETAEKMARIALSIASGMTAKKAAEAAGMKEATYYYWRQRAANDQRQKPSVSSYLFPAKGGECYTKSGLGASWRDVMTAYIKTLDPHVTEQTLVKHPMYYSLLDVRPVAITEKLQRRDADAIDFAGHANPNTTHKWYDRRKVKKAKATE